MIRDSITSAISVGEHRILMPTGPSPLDYVLATNLQQSFAAIHRLWANYDARRPHHQVSIVLREPAFHRVNNPEERVKRIKDFVAANSYKEKLDLYTSWDVTDSTVMNWFHLAIKTKAIPEDTLSVKKQLQLYSKLDLGIRFHNASSLEEKKKIIEESGYEKETILKYVELAKERGIL